MKNVTQTINFPVLSIVPTPLPETLNDLMTNARVALAKVQAASAPKSVPAESTPEETAALAALQAEADAQVAALLAQLPEQNKKELEHFGAKSVFETVAVSIKLGTLLFDLYSMLTAKPEAPLGQLIWQKRNMELAEAVDKDEFELPSWSVNAIRRALLDDETWKKANISAYVSLPAEGDAEPLKRFFTMKSMGAQFYGEVMQAAAEALYTDDLKATK
jgi:hypothetical protein